MIELLITIVIVSILAVVAIPSYQQYVLRGGRNLAKGQLLDLVSKQEAFSIENRAYAVTFQPLTGIGATTIYLSRNGEWLASETSEAIYVVSLQGPAGGTPPIATDFRLVAVAVGQQAKDTGCAQLLVGANGQTEARDSNDTINDDCWTR